MKALSWHFLTELQNKAEMGFRMGPASSLITVLIHKPAEQRVSEYDYTQENTKSLCLSTSVIFFAVRFQKICQPFYKKKVYNIKKRKKCIGYYLSFQGTCKFLLWGLISFHHSNRNLCKILRFVGKCTLWCLQIVIQSAEYFSHPYHLCFLLKGAIKLVQDNLILLTEILSLVCGASISSGGKAWVSRAPDVAGHIRTFEILVADKQH